MVKIKITYEYTPEEFRMLLPKKLRKVYDELVKEMVDMGVREEEAKVLVAQDLIFVVEQKMKEQKKKRGDSSVSVSFP